MHLFSAVILQTQGHECDCCVSVWEVAVDVFACDESEAKKLLERVCGLRTNQITSFQDEGKVEKVAHAGVKVNSASKVYFGVHYKSPLAVSK